MNNPYCSAHPNWIPTAVWVYKPASAAPPATINTRTYHGTIR